MNFGRIIDNNENINDRFKEMTKDCYQIIYDILGKKDFIRWAHTVEFEDDLRDIIIDIMTQEEEKENPNAAGFNNPKKNLIKVRDPKNEVETKRLLHVLIHENFHQITRHSSRFCTYINEGMTEYLTGMTVEEGSDSYLENVEMVKFLHNMLGDSVIKAYLLRER